MRALLVVLGVLCTPVWAAGSWVGSAGGVRVVMADRYTSSAPITAPADLQQGMVTSVRWQFQASPDKPLRGWLCHAEGCVVLNSGRGITERLAGIAADTAFHFRFALMPEQRQALQVQGLQVIVNYQ